MDSNENTRIAAISEEAALWFIRLKDDDLTALERQQYLAWLKQAPAHVAEMLRVSGVYSAVRGARLEGRISFDDREANVLEWPRAERIAAPRGRRAAAWGVAAVVAIATVLASTFLFLFADRAVDTRAIETDAGEWRHVTLEDGSFLRLGPHTALRVDLEDAIRSVELERGEATFQVAKDTSRPFIVDTGFAQVRAVGTMFGIERNSGRAVVTVAEGVVSIGAKNVGAGEQITVSRGGGGVVRRVDANRELAWAEGRFIFESETLAEALEEFNRRNRLQISADPDIASRPVRGVFDAADPESFVSFLRASADIDVRRSSADHLTLTKKGDDSRK